MGGLTDFLFGGTPPESVQTYGETVTNVPKWMSDYTQGLITRANAVAGEPYQPYTGPRIAGLNSDQQSSFNLTRANVGNYQPGIQRASEMTYEGGNQNPLGVAQGQFGLASADLERASGLSASGAAQPLLARAANTLPGSIDAYMDPYIGNVINRATDVANRNWRESIMPSLTDTFTNAGQFGSSRMAEIAYRGARDVSEGLQGQSLAALSDAYKNAGTNFQADQSRLGQLAQMTGALVGDDAARATQVAQQRGALGTSLANAASDTGKLQLAAGQQQGALAEMLQRLGLSDAAALGSVGNQMQGQTQRNLDLAYSDFKDQRDYPKQMTDWLSQIIRGLPPSAVPTSESSTKYGPASEYGPSPLSQIISAGTGLAGIKSALTGT